MLLLCSKRGIELLSVDDLCSQDEARLKFKREIDQAAFLDAFSESKTPRYTRYDTMREHFKNKDIYKSDEKNYFNETYHD